MKILHRNEYLEQKPSTLDVEQYLVGFTGLPKGMSFWASYQETFYVLNAADKGKDAHDEVEKYFEQWAAKYYEQWSIISISYC